jgi:hypothetical protein
MPQYRFYCLDSAGHISTAEWFDAPSDEEAVETVQALRPDGTCEIWEGKRLVASTKPIELRA